MPGKKIPPAQWRALVDGLVAAYEHDTGHRLPAALRERVQAVHPSQRGRKPTAGPLSLTLAHQHAVEHAYGKGEADRALADVAGLDTDTVKRHRLRNASRGVHIREMENIGALDLVGTDAERAAAAEGARLARALKVYSEPITSDEFDDVSKAP